MAKGYPKSGLNKGWFPKGHKPTHNMGMLGKKHSPETIRKMSIAKTKTPLLRPCDVCEKNLRLYPSTMKARFCGKECFAVAMKGREVWNKGKKGIQVSHFRGKQRPEIAGSNSPHWKGGLTTLMETIRMAAPYREWQRKVMERDRFTCRKCGTSDSGNMVPHHLTAFSFLLKAFEIKSVQDAVDCFWLWNIRNGITLCKPCHALTDNYGPKAKVYPKDRSYYPKIAVGILSALFFFAPLTSDAATFGYTTAGASKTDTTTDAAMSSRHTTTQAGDLDLISVFVPAACTTGNFFNGTVLAMYNATGGLLAEAAEITTGSAGTWIDKAFSLTVADATSYFLTAAQEDQCVAHDTVASTVNRAEVITYAAAAPASIGTTDLSNLRYSIYATYTASGGGGSTAPDDGILFFE